MEESRHGSKHVENRIKSRNMKRRSSMLQTMAENASGVNGRFPIELSCSKLNRVIPDVRTQKRVPVVVVNSQM